MERIGTFLLGVFAALLLMSLLGAESAEEADERAAIGRFQAVAAATYGQPYYWIVDTATGKVMATNFAPLPEQRP